MPTASQVRGALLEEAILWLLELAGYETITTVGTDPTLRSSSAGLIVRGRGSNHQIDAIADFAVGQPFSHPQRLLVEGKAYNPIQTVGLSVLRSAVGILKDVSEFTVGSKRPQHRRYHYQYAVFSLTPFTKPAQQYAFAQDIYLVPLHRSHFFAPIAQAIRGVNDTQPGRRLEIVAAWSHAVRLSVRDAMRATTDLPRGPLWDDLTPLIRAVRATQGGLLAVAARAFPLFLMPSQTVAIRALDPLTRVRIRKRHDTWYLERASDNAELFSFDLPEELFRLYAEKGVLTKSRALDMKSEVLSDIDAVTLRDGRKTLLTFQLDRDWLQQVRNELS